MDYGILFYLLILIVAALYSSVGHGGASGYLAIMAIFAVSPDNMRASALMLNLFVSAISFYAFYRGGFFRMRLLWPFILLSVPMSFIGARVAIEPSVYRVILGIFLILAVFRMIFTTKASVTLRPVHIPLALFLGALLGFFSGLIGIGGGIILSPILLLLRWASIKETAAVSAIFILLNSASGIVGLASAGALNPVNDIYLMIAAGISGSIAGSWLGRAKLTPAKLTYLLAGVLLFASFKLIYL
jgi:uncharacterized protein